uniref:PIG-P domain-containing protein n=1 Tax=Gongylonema pulchrum TaxID=637853 RepID=A0A183EEQ4_9BILA
LAVYLIWALIPTPYLELLHLTYVPAKYWAVALPLLLPITVAAFVIFVFAHNLIRLHGIFEDIEPFPPTLSATRLRGTQQRRQPSRRKMQLPKDMPAKTVSTSKIGEIVRKRLEMSASAAQASSDSISLDSLSAGKFLQ